MKKNVVVTAAAMLVLAIAGTPALAQSTAVSQPPTGQPATPFVTAGPRVDLSIEEAVARAREKNIDIGVARNHDFDLTDAHFDAHIGLGCAQIAGQIEFRVANAAFEIDASDASVAQTVNDQFADAAFNIQ